VQHLDWANGYFLTGEEIVAFQPVPLVARFVRGDDWHWDDALVASTSHGLGAQDHCS
jgi:hypothetical protein